MSEALPLDVHLSIYPAKTAGACIRFMAFSANWHA
jgi:hypothetical protein